MRTPRITGFPLRDRRRCSCTPGSGSVRASAILSAAVSAGSSPLHARLRRWSPSSTRLVFAAVALVALAVGSLIGFLETRSSSPALPAAASSATPPPALWAAGARRAPDFRLVDQSGKAVSLSGQHGRPVIVTFIDPLCRDFCPLEAKQLNRLVATLPAASRPAILAVSVNVYGNARANLLQDVRKWSLVPEWRWAVGTPKQLAAVWRSYQVGVLATAKKIAGVTVHQITHTEAAYVVDRNGYERALFLWPFTAKDVSSVLRQIAPASS